MKILGIFITALTLLLAASFPASANPKHLQAYKKAYPDAKAKCIICHIKEKATKTDHELNAYGVKAKEMGDASKEGYEAIGSVEQFEAEAAAENSGE